MSIIMNFKFVIKESGKIILDIDPSSVSLTSFRIKLEDTNLNFADVLIDLPFKDIWKYQIDSDKNEIILYSFFTDEYEQANYYINGSTELMEFSLKNVNGNTVTYEDIIEKYLPYKNDLFTITNIAKDLENIDDNDANITNSISLESYEDYNSWTIMSNNPIKFVDMIEPWGNDTPSTTYTFSIDTKEDIFFQTFTASVSGFLHSIVIYFPYLSTMRSTIEIYENKDNKRNILLYSSVDDLIPGDAIYENGQWNMFNRGRVEHIINTKLRIYENSTYSIAFKPHDDFASENNLVGGFSK